MNTFAFAVAALLALPFVTFRGPRLLAFLAVEAMVGGLAAAVWQFAPPADPYPAAVSLFVLILGAYCVALATGRDVVWSAGRAAVVVAIVYAAAMPTQIRVPIDGDEPFYLLMTESLVKDHDLDLANQYNDLAHSATRRPDLMPQQGDPVGPHGERYSRDEPFLAFLMIPGYLAGGLPGAVLTIALFGVLLVRSTVLLLEEEGISDATIRRLFPFFAFAPPILFYSLRIWPEVPGAFFFVEALRGVRKQNLGRSVAATFALMMLKLRFGLSGAVLLIAVLRQHGRRLRTIVTTRLVTIALLALIPLAAVWIFTGSILNVHSWRELLPLPPASYVRGTFGLLLDGAAGMLLNAPFYLLGIWALSQWRSRSSSVKLGAIAAAPYLFSLVPRSEWHGGWSPALRYVVVFMPLLLLAVAEWVEQRVKAPISDDAVTTVEPGSGVIPRGLVAIFALLAPCAMAAAAYGLSYPWQLFHIENGENRVGEWLSTTYRSDFSRLFPSYIRINHAATVGALVAVALFLLLRRMRIPAQLVAPAIALVLAAGFVDGGTPARVVEFEDAHVLHRGGELYPEYYTVERFKYRCGWRLHPGDSMSFLAKKGPALLEYTCAAPVTIVLDGRRYRLPPTGNDHWAAAVTIPHDGRVELTSVDGIANFDRMRP